MPWRGSPPAPVAATRVGVAGAAVMAVTFGMGRYVYGLTLPDIRAELAVPELLLGLVASGTFLGFLLALLLSTPLAARRGPRVPTTLGGVSGTVGCGVVAAAPTPAVLATGALVAGSAAGWVWAPYSAIVAAVAPEPDRPRLLAWVTTGACAGLIVVAPLALAVSSWAPGGSWRWTWAGIAVLSAVATVVNLRWVPRLPPTPRASRRGRNVVLTRPMLRPLTVAVVLFAAATAYFTYATDAARRGGLGEMAGPEVFVLVGATGLAGLGAGAMAMKVGARVVATGALVVLGASVLVLGLGAGSLAAVLTSAGLFGVGNTVGSAALPIWTAELVPGHPAAAFAAALVVGSLSSIATPAVVGALTPRYGLTAVLVAVAFATAATGLALAVTRRRPERRAPAG